MPCEVGFGFFHFHEDECYLNISHSWLTPISLLMFDCYYFGCNLTFCCSPYLPPPTSVAGT